MSRSMDDALTAYDFAAPPLIRFGAGRIDELGELVGLWGRRAWIVGGGRSLTASGARQRIDSPAWPRQESTPEWSPRATASRRCST
jgi:alcohol dehydrogenase YqhD (iron-dependent ADH family)